MLLPQGLAFAGVACGIKASGKRDLALIVADRPCVAVCVTTTNQIVAAPVEICRKHSPTDAFRAVIINSGNANACTGDVGMRDARTMCEIIAARVGCDVGDVLVMSTGIIGETLPMDAIEGGIETAFASLDPSPASFIDTADAICTTDQFRKVATRSVTIGNETYSVAAMAKGAGMIAPNMATMLAVIMVDAPLSTESAAALLRRSVDTTFNRVSVDGHTSTNDTVALISTGSPNEQLDDAGIETLGDVITDLSLQLSKMLVADGEGAGRFFEVCVNGAQSIADAETIARVVGASPLVKTAIFGGDPNWGRIVSAAGYAGPALAIDQLTLKIDGVVTYLQGQPVDFDSEAVSSKMKAADEVRLELTVGDGPGVASCWASDLSEEYVRFNSLYTT
ncbi:MAG: bifunctional glutamate N-acetyltransferase/amino-acid acetyltransferase ArgJ [Planctomycetota bacterium]